MTTMRLETGYSIGSDGSDPMCDSYTVDSQDVNVFTVRPKWSQDSDSPAVGCICAGRYYFLRRHADGVYDRDATKHNAGLPIE